MTGSGLPSDETVAQRAAQYEAEQRKRQERIDFIAPAFGKLTDDQGDDLEDTIRSVLQRGDGINLSIDELEQIAKRIAELNAMVMQGVGVLDEASIRREAAEVERVEREATLATQRPFTAQEAGRADAQGYDARQRAAIEARKAGMQKSKGSPL